MRPAVSVLIPAYNAESTVAAAIASVQRQTLADLQIVVVDDGSTDATPAILDDLAASDPRLHVLHLARGGIIPTLNAGLGLCASDLIARMDADDISHPRRLELQYELMQSRSEISVCSSLVRMFPRRELLGGMVQYERWLNSLITPEEIARDMFVESPVAHPSVMMRKHELEELGAYQEHGWAEDYDLWLRYHTAGKRFAKIDRMLTCWRQSQGRLTFTDPRYSLENFIRAKAFYLCRMLAGSDRPLVLWGAGKMGRRLAKHLTRGGLRIKAVVDIDPKKIGHTMRGAPIVAPDYLREHWSSFVIAAVGSATARELIRDYLRGNGCEEIRDFVCAA